MKNELELEIRRLKRFIKLNRIVLLNADIDFLAELETQLQVLIALKNSDKITKRGIK